MVRHKKVKQNIQKALDLIFAVEKGWLDDYWKHKQSSFKAVMV